MDIIRPTLVVNKKVCMQNIELMAEKARRHKLRFRPHFKTHQSVEIGRWFRQCGVEQITVSSVKMAKYFLDDGWNDITIAFPFNTLETTQLNELADKAIINIVVDSETTICLLENKLTKPVGVYIKITTGYNRVGIPDYSLSKIEHLISLLKQNELLEFKGLLSHAGHTYHALSKNEVQSIHFDAVHKLNNLKQHLLKKHPGIEISIGDTPGCTSSEYFNGVDEIRPGNFVFYDLKQHSLGVCKIDDIALRLHCPVVSKQRVRNEIIVYCGAIQLSLDSIQNTDGKPLYGRIIVTDSSGKHLLDNNCYVARLSQEHGVIKLTPEAFNQVAIGNVIEIIPVHSCLTAQAMGGYITTKGDKIAMMNNA